MQLESKALPFDLKAAAPDGSSFEGHAACFHNIDSYGDIIAPGAFLADLPWFLANGAVCWQHDWSEPIGLPTKAVEDARGLDVAGTVEETTQGKDARILIAKKVVRKLSIGFRTLGRKWLETSEEVADYWAEHGYTPTPEDIAASAYGARLLTRIKNYEFSPVTFAANNSATIDRVKAPDSPAGRTFAAHSETVLAALEEFLTRCQDLSDLRRKDGRGLEGGQRKALREMRAKIDGLLDATETRCSPEDRARALAQLARTKAALTLALYGEPAAGAT